MSSSFANVDDTDGFLKAARAHMQGLKAESSAAAAAAAATSSDNTDSGWGAAVNDEVTTEDPAADAWLSAPEQPLAGGVDENSIDITIGQQDAGKPYMSKLLVFNVRSQFESGRARHHQWKRS